MLPDGKTVLFTLATTGTWVDSQIVTQSLETSERRVLIDGGADARYVPTGHVVYAVGETLLAAPFHLERLELTGGPVPVVEGVARAPAVGVATGAAHASFSDSGSLAFVPVTSFPQRVGSNELVWVDRQGVENLLTQTHAGYLIPRISPDGRRLAVTIMEENRDIWIYETARGTLTRLTFHDGIDTDPVWSPDGQRIAFYSDRRTADGVGAGIFAKAADSSGEAVSLGAQGGYPSSWSVDGRIAFRVDRGMATATNTTTSKDIGVLSLDGDPKEEILLGTSFQELHPSFSPDGRWLAYTSDESGQREVYVRPFPGPGGKWQISTGGGGEPIWARDGTEIFYRNGDKMMAVPVSTDGSFTPGKPVEFFEGHYAVDPFAKDMQNYDVAPDGRFVMIKEGEDGGQDPAPVQIHVVLNWFQELKRLVPPSD
jgi:serine/threonine-protein kinase